MRILVIFSAFLAVSLAAPSGPLAYRAAVPAATHLPYPHAVVPAKVETIEAPKLEIPAHHYGYGTPFAYGAHLGYGAPFGYHHPEPAVEVKAEAVEVADEPVEITHPAPLTYAHRPVPVAYAHPVPVTTVEKRVGPPRAVPAGPPQRTVHYGTFPEVTGYTSTIHKPSVAAPRIGVPATLLGKVEHQPAEVTVEKYDVNVKKVEPVPRPVKVPVPGEPIYDNTVIKHEPVIRTHTAVHHAQAVVPVATAHAVETTEVEAAPVAHAGYPHGGYGYPHGGYGYAHRQYGYAPVAHTGYAHRGYSYAHPTVYAHPTAYAHPGAYGHFGGYAHGGYLRPHVAPAAVEVAEAEE